MDNLGKGGQAFMLRESGAESLDDLAARLTVAIERAGGIIDAALALPDEAPSAVSGDD
jgi:glutamate-ammonia-ligase adenylyltransferase